MLRSLAIIAVLGWAGLAAAQVDTAVVLRNPVLELHLGRSPVPHVERLVHKKSNTAVVVRPWDRDLFALVLRGDDGKQRTILASEAKRSKLEVSQIEGGRAALMEWSEFPNADISVRATVRSNDAEPLLTWSIEVDNRSGGSLDAVRFPRLAAVPAIGESADDFLVLPALPGILIDNPAEAWPPGYGVLLKYPGNLAAQFIAYQDRAAGVYLSSRDTAGHSLSLHAARHKNGFLLWHEYAPPADRRKDKSWVAPYPVVIGVTQGTWCDSADLYKRWALRQSWCAKTLAQRDDIPDWWKKGPDVHVVGVRTYDKEHVCNGSYYPKLMDHLQTYRRQIDGPVVPMLASWENHRRWTGGDYFPIFDEPQARKVIKQMRGEGFRPFFFLSGLFYTFDNEGRNGSKIPAAQTRLSHFVVDEKTGEPATYTLNESNPGGTWKRHSYQFCVADPATKEFFRKVVDQAHELGIDVLQMDQTTSGAGAACYSDKHGHAPGPGLYQTKAFHDVLQAMRERGKKNTADFVLFHEEPHEQLIPYLDGFHVREYYAARWYRAYRGTVGIPLFCYLYHEYAIGFGGDSAGLSKHNSRHNVRAHAINLVTGRTPGGSVWSGQQSALDAHADQITMLRNHCRLLKTPADEFLMLGRMLHPFELDVPKLTFRWPDRRDRNKVTITEDPAVLTSSWQSPSGRIGHLFVNMSEEAQPLTVRIDSRNLPAWPLCDVSLYSSAEDDAFHPLWKRTALPKQFTRTLKPLEVVFLEIRQAP